MRSVWILCLTSLGSAKFSNDCCKSDNEWNDRGIGKKLKSWLNSFQVENRSYSKPFDSVSLFPNGQVEFVGHIDAEGFADGPFWISLGQSVGSNFSNGYFYAELDPQGDITGDSVAYIYPDMSTALIGQFLNGTMKMAHESKIIHERCFAGVKRVRFAGSKQVKTFSFGRPNHLRLNFDPTQTDPYESRSVFVSESGEKGEGLFARRTLRPGELVSYYSGLILDPRQHEIFHDNMTEEEVNAAHKFLISLEGELEINLPQDYWSLDRYRATLGHKVNHSFKDVNSEFVMAFNPRFGWIRGIQAIKLVERGQEILVDYGYSLEESECPSWYLSAYKLQDTAMH